MIFTMVSIDCSPRARIAEPVGAASSDRSRSMPRRRAWLWAATFAVSAFAGCGGSSQPAPNSDDGQVRAAMTLLGMEYGGFMAAHKGAPPKDEAEMRKYLESRLSELSDYNVKSVDTLLRNGRDGQPLVLVIGTKIENPERSPSPWAAYEKVGVDGKRLVSDSRGGVYEIEEQEFSQHVPSG
jgi:hypothetical protein